MTELLDLAIKAHGGMGRWTEVRSIDLKLSIGGGLWQYIGLPEGLDNVHLHIKAHEPSVSITPFGDARTISHLATSGHFTPERVWIEDASGNLVSELQMPRESFSRHEFITPWSKLQELYLTGYALWNYLATPFLLAGPGVETEEIEPHEENGETWRRLAVRFPAGIPTHSPAQTFYFGQSGLLHRLDYNVDIVGGAPGAHYCFDHTSFGGIVVPTLRRVVNRSARGPDLSGPTGVLVRISHVVIE
jgi:hypothetical protein